MILGYGRCTRAFTVPLKILERLLGTFNEYMRSHYEAWARKYLAAHVRKLPNNKGGHLTRPFYKWEFPRIFHEFSVFVGSTIFITSA
jgi:hypothetical protein